MNSLLRLIHLTVIAASVAAASVFCTLLGFKLGGLPMIIWIVACFILASPPKTWRTTLGSARFATYLDLQLSGLLERHRGMLLGRTFTALGPTLRQRILATLMLPWNQSKDANAIFHANTQRRLIYVPDTLVPHTAIIAPTGAGKSAGHAIPNLLTNSDSAVILDFKCEIYRATAEARRRMGHQIVLIAPFGMPDDIDAPIAQFNPLQLCDPDSQYLIDEAAALANSLVIRQPQEHQPFFNDSAELVIKAVLMMLLVEAGAEECTLAELRKITALPDELEKATRLMMTSKSPYAGVMRQQGGQLLSLIDKTALDVIATIHTHLAWLDSPSIAQSLSQLSFHPGALMDPSTPMSIYVHIPVHRLATYQGYIRTLMTSLFNYIFAKGESKSRRIRFFLDESYGLGRKLVSLYDALIYGRSYGMRLHFYFQALSQVEDVFEGSKARDFRGNVALAYTGIRDFETAQQVSAWIGRQTIEARNRQTGFSFGTSYSENMRSGPTWGKNWGTSSSTSYQEQMRELIQPEEILQLPANSTLCTLPHIPPAIVEPMFYFSDRRLRRLSRLKPPGR
ncbi:MAG: type IV secretory system conjugative DNA transfer family protein [Pirellulaceae bacterium]